MPLGVPPGPSYPSSIQSIGFWKRPLAFLERCRARYGKRFTIRLPLAPPFVMISDPAEIKQVFTAPPDVLHPGEGARVLEPVVGTHSVILLDEAAHIEQRKLILPAFHGERMERLSDLIAEASRLEIARWPRGRPIERCSRLELVTLEIILLWSSSSIRPSGSRAPALSATLLPSAGLSDQPALPPPPGSVARLVEATVQFAAAFLRMQEGADALLFELIDERRREDSERDDILSHAGRCAPRGRIADVRPGAARRADHPARRRARDHRVDAGMALPAPVPAPKGLSRLTDRSPARTETPTSPRRRRRRCGAGRCRRTRPRGWSSNRSRSGAGRTPRTSAWFPMPTWSTTIPRSIRIRRLPARALPGRATRHDTWVPFGGDGAASARALRARDEDRDPQHP